VSFGIQCDHPRCDTFKPVLNTEVPFDNGFLILTRAGVEHHFCSTRCVVGYLNN
jgi:hypothetical protein